MPSPEALEPPTGLSFGDLIDWHLRRGTRPPGSDRQGEPWKRAAFANDVRVSDKQVRNWIANKSLPNDTITIERVLFGRSQEQRIAWRMELRDALRRTRTGSASTDPAPGEIGLAIRAQAEVAPIRAPEATAGGGTTPGDLWRYVAPYRGLAAMTEEDSDFFFGRMRETVEVLEALATPGRLPVLIGNSGVGKSSLAQAGVLAALKRQAWPDGRANAWPPVFQNGRQWCFLKLRPGAEPLKAVVDAFLDVWQFETEHERVKERNGFGELLLGGETSLSDLIDATEHRYRKLNQAKPPAFFLYVDQGEELYVRAEARQRARFSETIARALADPACSS